MRKIFTPKQKNENNTEGETITAHRDQLLLPLSIVGVFCFPPFFIYNFARGNFVLGSAILALTLIFFFNSYALYRRRKPPIPFELLLIPSSLAIVLSTIYQGIYGTYWCYPLLLYFFFVLPRRVAILCSVLLLVTVTYIVLQYIGLDVATRFGVSFGLLLVLANIIVGVMDELYGKLHQDSIKDPLTGAFNRRYMESRLSDAIAQRQRQPVQPSVLALDIDFFKRINDDLGHAAGDEVLKGIVKLITERVRQSDKLFRVGGEEFLLFLPETSEEAAIRVGEELRGLIAAADLLENRPVTISIGVSELLPHETLDDWIKSADEALYRAKAEGRNRVEARNPASPAKGKRRAGSA